MTFIKNQIKVRRKSIRVIWVFARGEKQISLSQNAIDSLINENPKENAKIEFPSKIRGARANNVVVGDPELIKSIEKLTKKS